MPTLEINLGKGMGFDENSIETEWESSSVDNKDIKRDDGIYIPSLVGKNGSGGGTVIDNWTAVPNGYYNTIQFNRETVQMLHSMCAWQTVPPYQRARGAGSFYILTSNGQRVYKQKSHIINEVNCIFDEGGAWTSYIFKKNDLFMMFDIPYDKQIFHVFNNGGANRPMEDGNRYEEFICIGIFVVEDVTADGRGYLSDVKLKCLWAKSGTPWSKGNYLN